MATAHINPFDEVNRGANAFATPGQCFKGFCAQDRVDIATVPASYSSTPALTVAAGVRYLTIETDAKIKVYAGPPATDAVKQARAVVTSGYLPAEVDPGDVVHIWLP